MKKKSNTRQLLITIIKNKGACTECTISCPFHDWSPQPHCGLHHTLVGDDRLLPSNERRYLNAICRFISKYGEEPLITELL